MTPPNPQRHVGLARTLSKLGYCSRNQAFILVRAGRVAVNGRRRLDPESPVAATDTVTVDGHPVTSSTRIYLMMNKPRGLVTTSSDEKGRPTVYSLLTPQLPWIAPVGRLDQASEGLLLFTNDSEWAAKVTAPDSHLPKTYRVQVDAVASSATLIQLCNGVTARGEQLRALHVTVVRTGQKNSWLDITLDEGRNRHIRRMFAALGIEVLRLMRISIGPIQLGDLKKGEVRRLTTEEKDALDRALQAGLYATIKSKS
jgi:23S rRNA pseudouridine2605 synthase